MIANQTIWDALPGAVYCRISLDKTGEGLGVARQLADCHKLAELRNVQVADRKYSDNDLSASGRVVRPDFERLLKDIEAGLVKVVIAWDMTRLTRNAKDFLRLSELGKKTGLKLMFVHGAEVDFTDPVSRSMAEIVAVFARMETETKGLRQASANRQRAEQGVPRPGRRLLGYEIDGKTVRTLMCPACPGTEGYTDDRECVACGAEAINEPGSEADDIDRACDDLLAGVSLMQTARAWQAKGYLTQAGKPFRYISVRRLLLNPRIAGLRTYRQEIVGRAQWPALVSETKWRAVVAVLEDPVRRQNPKPKTANMLLSGIAICSSCRQTIHYGTRVRGKARYRCTPGCMTRQIADVDNYVVGHIVARLSQPDARELVPADEESIDVSDLRAERLALTTRQADLARLFAVGKLTTPQLEAGTAAINTQTTAIDAKLAQAGRTSALGPLIDAEDVLAAWQALDIHRQREVVRTLVDVVVYPPGRGAKIFDPATVMVTWRR